MAKDPDDEAARKRAKIQARFYSEVGSVEHVNVPKLEASIKKEFRTENVRLVKTQVRLMQTEGRVKIQNKVKVWIKQPSDLSES